MTNALRLALLAGSMLFAMVLTDETKPDKRKTSQGKTPKEKPANETATPKPKPASSRSRGGSPGGVAKPQTVRSESDEHGEHDNEERLNPEPAETPAEAETDEKQEKPE